MLQNIFFTFNFQVQQREFGKDSDSLRIVQKLKYIRGLRWGLARRNLDT